MYQFRDEINFDVYFRFNKMNIKNLKWANLPLPSKSIFPVIAVHCDRYGVAKPSKQTIAILAGCSEKTVHNGLQGLKDYPGFQIDKYVTSRGKRANKYHISFPSMEQRGKSFPFYKSIITGANWRLCSPASHAVFPVMHCFSQFDFLIYAADEDLETYDDPELFKERKYQYCCADIDVIAEYAGITLITAQKSIEELEYFHLIEYTEDYLDAPAWKVYYHSPYNYVCDELNERIRKRYSPKKENVTY